MSFSELFLALRALLDLRQAEMARLLRISQGALSKIEQGRIPRASTFVRAFLLTAQGPRAYALFDRFYKEYESFYGRPEIALSPAVGKRQRGGRVSKSRPPRRRKMRKQGARGIEA